MTADRRGGSLLLLGARRRVFLAQHLRARLRDEWGARLVATDTDDLDPVRHFVDAFALLPPARDPQFVGALRAVCERHGVAGIVPWNDDDITVLSRVRQDVEAIGATVVLPPDDIVRMFTDKRRTAEWAARHGIPHPRVYGPQEPAVPPLVRKPRFGQGAVGVSYLDTAEQVAAVRARADDGDYLLQAREYGTEYTVDVALDRRADPVFVVPRRRVKVRGSEVVVAQVDLNPKIVGFVTGLCHRLDFRGIFNLQLFEAGGACTLLEFNPRFGGGSDLAIAAGADIPGTLVRLAYGLPLTPTPLAAIRNGLIMTRYHTPVFFSREDPPGHDPQAAGPGAPAPTIAPRPVDRAWRAGSFAFRDHAVPIPPDVLAAVTTPVAGRSTGEGAADPAAGFTGRVRAGLLDGGPGYALLTGLADRPEGTWRDAFERLCLALAERQAQDAAGMMVREVRDRGTAIGEGAIARYSDSRQGGSFHTDGAQAPLPVPDYFALLCVRQSATGGAFQMVSVDTVVAALRESVPELLPVLFRPWCFDGRGDLHDGRPWVSKPILFETGRRELAVTYLREYIEAGHRREGAPALTAEQRRALDALDGVLADPDCVVEGKLRPGEILFVANTRILHARTAFTDTPGAERLLLRMWLRRRPGER